MASTSLTTPAHSKPVRTANRPIRAVVVTNVPAPYRVPVYNRVATLPDIDLQVVYCAPPHIDPTLDAAAHDFPVHFLTGSYWAMNKRFMHLDWSVTALLNRLAPDVIVTTGFIPTFLFAFAWAVRHGAAHVAMTDGTAQSERALTCVHRWVRRRVFAHSASFVGACGGSLDLFRAYGLPEDHLHLSRLCVDNARFALPRRADAVDFMYCGRFVNHKNPIFALKVARLAAEKLKRKTSIAFVGQGPLEEEVRQQAVGIADSVEVCMYGYSSQARLPELYAGARILLFPSEWDPWGLVANEACAAGLPVLASSHTGVAGELVGDGENGYVLPLEDVAWAEAAVRLLTDAELYARLSAQARVRVAEYTFDDSARGLANAIRQAAACVASSVDAAARH